MVYTGYMYVPPEVGQSQKVVNQSLQYRSQVTLHLSASDTRVTRALLASRFACAREYVYEYSRGPLREYVYEYSRVHARCIALRSR